MFNNSCVPHQDISRKDETDKESVAISSPTNENNEIINKEKTTNIKPQKRKKIYYNRESLLT